MTPANRSVQFRDIDLAVTGRRQQSATGDNRGTEFAVFEVGCRRLPSCWRRQIEKDADLLRIGR